MRRMTLHVLASCGAAPFGVVACMLVALVLRAPYLHATLGIDEGGLTYIAQHWGSGHGSLYGSYWVDRPPLLLALFRLAGLGGASGVHVLGAVAAVALVGLVFALGRELGGTVTGLGAALLAALLTGSAAIDAVHTPAELLAAVPSTASLLALLIAHRTGRLRWVAAAGALAVCALLIKQSFLDAGAAGAVFVLVAGPGRLRRSFAYAAGVAVPLAAVLAWTVAADVPPGRLMYALVGFRLDAITTLAGSSIPLASRVSGLALPVLGSGLVVVLVVAGAGLVQLRRERVVAITLTAWLAAAVLGVLGGGSYWPHYLIELVAVTSVAAAYALTQLRPVLRRAALATAVGFAVLGSVAATVAFQRDPPHRTELRIAGYLRAHAQPGDTQYVMYARANIAFYSRLPSPYPYAWSLMVRALPGARARLHALLRSPRRPTWLVVWQDDDTWQLDRRARVDRAMHAGYRRVAIVGGKPIYHRTGRERPAPL